VPSRVEEQRKLRKAARAIGRHRLAHAYGHASLRLDCETFLVCPSMPMSHIPPGAEGTVVPIDGPLPDGVLGEVRIHREIYRRRPEICGVVRSMPPSIMSLSTLRLTPQARHGFGSYFQAAGIPLWDSPLLIRDDDKAAALADAMGSARAIVMRGNGLVIAGETIEEAVVLTWYAEDAARIELDVVASNGAGDPTLITTEEATIRATWSGRILDRMWDYLTYDDPEG
jgi:HCOMODA/2-hydroxy-3-carboxy-muconic semialdehyde decarboxylase